jgi:hypothetical protein
MPVTPVFQWLFTHAASGVLRRRRAGVDWRVLFQVSRLRLGGQAVADSRRSGLPAACCGPTWLDRRLDRPLLAEHPFLVATEPLGLPFLDLVHHVLALPLAASDLVVIGVDIDVLAHGASHLVVLRSVDPSSEVPVR